MFGSQDITGLHQQWYDASQPGQANDGGVDPAMHQPPAQPLSGTDLGFQMLPMPNLDLGFHMQPLLDTVMELQMLPTPDAAMELQMQSLSDTDMQLQMRLAVQLGLDPEDAFGSGVVPQTPLGVHVPCTLPAEPELGRPAPSSVNAHTCSEDTGTIVIDGQLIDADMTTPASLLSMADYRKRLMNLERLTKYRLDRAAAEFRQQQKQNLEDCTRMPPPPHPQAHL